MTRLLERKTIYLLEKKDISKFDFTTTYFVLDAVLAEQFISIRRCQIDKLYLYLETRSTFYTKVSNL